MVAAEIGVGFAEYQHYKIVSHLYHADRGIRAYAHAVYIYHLFGEGATLCHAVYSVAGGVVEVAIAVADGSHDVAVCIGTYVFGIAGFVGANKALPIFIVGVVIKIGFAVAAVNGEGKAVRRAGQLRYYLAL